MTWAAYAEVEEYTGLVRVCLRRHRLCSGERADLVVEKVNRFLKSQNGVTWARGRRLRLSLANGMTEWWSRVLPSGRDEQGRIVLVEE